MTSPITLASWPGGDHDIEIDRSNRTRGPALRITQGHDIIVISMAQADQLAAAIIVAQAEAEHAR